MARLDVHPNPGRGGEGYVVDVQADLLSHLTTRVVIPLLPMTVVRISARGLNPVFDIQGQPHALITQAIATVPRRELKGAVMSLKDRHDTILTAIDLLLTGF